MKVEKRGRSYSGHGSTAAAAAVPYPPFLMPSSALSGFSIISPSSTPLALRGGSSTRNSPNHQSWQPPISSSSSSVPQAPSSLPLLPIEQALPLTIVESTPTVAAIIITAPTSVTASPDLTSMLGEESSRRSGGRTDSGLTASRRLTTSLNSNQQQPQQLLQPPPQQRGLSSSVPLPTTRRIRIVHPNQQPQQQQQQQTTITTTSITRTPSPIEPTMTSDALQTMPGSIQEEVVSQSIDQPTKVMFIEDEKDIVAPMAAVAVSTPAPVAATTAVQEEKQPFVAAAAVAAVAALTLVAANEANEEAFKSQPMSPVNIPRLSKLIGSDPVAARAAANAAAAASAAKKKKNRRPWIFRLLCCSGGALPSDEDGHPIGHGNDMMGAARSSNMSSVDPGWDPVSIPRSTNATKVGGSNIGLSSISAFPSPMIQGRQLINNANHAANQQKYQFQPRQGSLSVDNGGHGQVSTLVLS